MSASALYKRIRGHKKRREDTETKEEAASILLHLGRTVSVSTGSVSGTTISTLTPPPETRRPKSRSKHASRAHTRNLKMGGDPEQLVDTLAVAASASAELLPKWTDPASTLGVVSKRRKKTPQEANRS